METTKQQFGNVREAEIADELNPPKAVKQFKVSCASINKIMGIKSLGKTGENYLKDWYLSKKFNRKKEFFSLYVEKGLRVEDMGIQILKEQKLLPPNIEKNDEWFENDFINGIPDIVLADSVYDIKSSWSLFTFPYFDTELQNDDYDWQLQGYMALTGFNTAYIAYLLIDTPQPLIDQELKKLYYQTGGKSEDWTPDTYAELAENYKFSDIPIKDRIKIFEVKRDEEKIKKIEERVLVCREYLKSIVK